MTPKRYQCGDCGSDTLVWKLCRIPGCEDRVLATSLCSKHYNRQWRNGDPLRYKKGNVWQVEDTEKDGTLMDMSKEEFWARARRPR